MHKPNILVAGGAGYIGSHFCYYAKPVYTPIVVDKITSPTAAMEQYRRNTMLPFTFIDENVGNHQRMKEIITQHNIKAAVYFAGWSDVADSDKQVQAYWENNVVNFMLFLRALEETGVKHLVFMSTASLYDSNDSILPEDARILPKNTYAMNKFACEKLLEHQPFTCLTLRLFNVAGAWSRMGLGELHDPETHLIPRAIAAVQNASTIYVNGCRLRTPDGTAIRDYVHVLDVADACMAGLYYLINGGRSQIFNIGSGIGTSVNAVINAVSKAMSTHIDRRPGPARDNEPISLIADITRARRSLHWMPKRDMTEIILSAIEFHEGYRRLAASNQPPKAP